VNDTVPPRQHDSYAALRLPAFRLYFAGNTIVVLGWQMQKVAVGWEVYELTNSALHLGYVGLVQFLPLVALVVLAGHVTDTYNRKHVLMAALGLNALADAGLAWNSAALGSVGTTYACLFLTGVARSFQNPSRAAFLPRIVPREVFPNAVTWNSSGFELSTMAGPALGGFVIWYFQSPALVYALNGCAALAFMALVAGIRYHHVVQEKARVTVDSLLAGFRYIRANQVVLGSITLDMFGVLLGGATALMPIYARDILAVGSLGLGWLMAAPAIGAFSMAMFQAHRPPFRRAGRTLIAAVAGFGTVTILFGLSESFALSMGMLYLLGACDNISVVIRQTLVQLLTPDEMRGRVSAINFLFIGTSNELGGFESGMVAGFFGPVASVVSGGLGTLLVVAAVAAWMPKLRRFGALVEPDP
jgi:MFS family permease